MICRMCGERETPGHSAEYCEPCLDEAMDVLRQQAELEAVASGTPLPEWFFTVS